MEYETIYVILNGPPGCGKTTITNGLCGMLRERVAPVIKDSFAAPMKHFVSTLMGVRYQGIAKDAPIAELSGRSVREFLINLSETYIKEEYSPDFFGRMLVFRSLRNVPKPLFVVCDDGGFPDEFAALPRDRYLIRVMRQGCTFEGDSRDYIPDPDYTIFNNSDLEDLWIRVRSLATTLLTVQRPI